MCGLGGYIQVITFSELKTWPTPPHIVHLNN